MNVGKPQVLVIASVLKPVDDVRMYKKIAKSLVETDKYTVNIVGFYAQSLPSDTSVRFHPLFAFPRLHWKRLLANIQFYQKLKEIAPHILMLTTPELYPATWWYNKRFGVYLVYDMVENYSRNVRYNRSFSFLLVAPLASLVQRIERRLLLVARIILSAEKGYVSELNLSPDKVSVIENKALRPPVALPERSRFSAPLSVIYTGTASEVYGILQAVNLVRLLVEQEGMAITLTVLAHVPQASLLQQLQTLALRYPWLKLRTSLRPVPHDDILSLLGEADFGMVSHQPVPSIAHCFPTRIWEYMAFRLPFLLQDHPYWTTFCLPWDCAVILDFNNPDTQRIKQQMLESLFYPKGVPDTIYWEEEEKKLTAALAEATTYR